MNATATVRMPPLWRALLTVTALAAAWAWGLLGAMFWPAAEAVRVRNAFLAAAPLPAAFDWQPPTVPDGFRQQRGPAPALMADAVRAVRADRPVVENVVALVNALNPGKRRGGPIQARTLMTYQLIARERTGYCADYTQVLNGLAWAAGIPVREWGMSFDGFGGDGHAFNEVYDAQRGQWVFVDAFNGFWVRDRAGGQPLSVLEFRTALAAADPLAQVELVRFRRAELGFRTPQLMIDYYRGGLDQFFLWWGNDVFDYDERWPVRLAGHVSRGLEQLSAMAFGFHPSLRILPTATNQPLIDALAATRQRALGLAALGVALLALLALELVAWRRYRRPTRA